MSSSLQPDVFVPPSSAPRPEPEKPPLLPPILTSPFALLWLWVLPIAVLLALNLQGYALIEGNMNEAQRAKAHLLGMAGLVNLLAGLVFFAVLRARVARHGRDSTQQPVLGVPAIVIQIAYLWMAMTWSDDILPATVTTWIYPTERFLLNQFAFGLLPLFLGILWLACLRPATTLPKEAAINLSLAIAAPAALYLGYLLVESIAGRGQVGPVLVALAIVTFGILMFTALVRGMMVGLRAIQGWRIAGERVAILVFALAMPIGGLLLNRKIPFPVDFQAWELYALTVVNAAVLFFASLQHQRRPLLSFCLLCGSLPFTLYFFVVFLPYLPLSILAILVWGAGFLVLAPTFLFTLHIHLLGKSRRNSTAAKPRVPRWLAGALCVFALPTAFTLRGLADKSALNAALDYVYEPSIKSASTTYPADTAKLRRALASHRSHKEGIRYPLISDYYDWLVFDNLVLPDDKILNLERIFLSAQDSSAPSRQSSGFDFFGSRGRSRERLDMARPLPPPRTVEVRELEAQAQAAGDDDTVVTFKMTLANTGERVAAEYVKALPLPTGVFVSGLRLHINGVPVPGRIVEKKSAMWVYAMIRDSERRDPALLVYTSPDELELRVFPIATTAPTIVEIDFLAPAKLDATALPTASKDPAVALAALGRQAPPQLVRGERGAVLAGKLDTLALPAVERASYLHLLIDRSADNGFTGDLEAALRLSKARFPEARSARVSLVNHDIVDLVGKLTSLDELAHRRPENLDRILPFSGGFATDLALAHAIRLHAEFDLDHPSTLARPPLRPVFVILGRENIPRPLDLDVSLAWARSLSKFEIHEIAEKGHAVVLRDEGPPDSPLVRLGNSTRSLVTGRAVSFQPSNESDRLDYWSPSISKWIPIPGIAEHPSGSRWSQAVSVHLRQDDYARDPGGAGLDLRAVVQASRQAGILIPATSYIVVENEAQWRMLDITEEKKLGQNKALEVVDTPTPSALLMIFALAFVGIARRLRGK